MCDTLISNIPSSLSQIEGFDLYEVCYMMSSSYEPEYPEIVSKDICTAYSNYNPCSSDGVPVKAEICSGSWD